MKITPTPKNIVLAVLGAAVIGLGTVVAVDHTAGAARPVSATPASVQIPSALRSVIGTAATGSATGASDAYAQRIAELFGLTPDQLKSAVESGQTLDQIAGAKDQTIKNEILEYLSAALDKAVAKGAISPGQESSVKQDATDLLNQLFAAKIGALAPGG